MLLYLNKYSQKCKSLSWQYLHEDLLSYMSRSEIATANILQKLANCSSFKQPINARMLSAMIKTTNQCRNIIYLTQENLSLGVCEQHRRRQPANPRSMISVFVIRFLESYHKVNLLQMKFQFSS